MSAPRIDLAAAVGQIARHYPAAIPLLESLDVEYASAGARSLREAATAAGIAPDALVAALRAATGEQPVEKEQPLPELIEQIIEQHHRFEDARAMQLLADLEGAGDRPGLDRIRRLLLALVAAMNRHMLREEREIFPRIEELALHPHRVRAGSITQPLLNELIEHDTIHEMVVKIRELTLRLRGTGTSPALLDSLDELDRSIHRHLHAENNVLIPRVVDLENQMRSTRTARAVTSA